LSALKNAANAAGASPAAIQLWMLRKVSTKSAAPGAAIGYSSPLNHVVSIAPYWSGAATNLALNAAISLCASAEVDLGSPIAAM
jgi:hypothetical protein